MPPRRPGSIKTNLNQIFFKMTRIFYAFLIDALYVQLELILGILSILPGCGDKAIRR